MKRQKGSEIKTNDTCLMKLDVDNGAHKMLKRSWIKPKNDKCKLIVQMVPPRLDNDETYKKESKHQKPSA